MRNAVLPICLLMLISSIIEVHADAISLDCKGTIVDSTVNELFHLTIDDNGVAFTQFRETKYYNNENSTLFRMNNYEITFGGPMIKDVNFKYVIIRSTGKYVQTWEGPGGVVVKRTGGMR